MAAATLAGSSLPSRARAQAGRPKRVIIVGAGIAGLSCAYELMRRGHEVVVLEGSGRTGGHILTVRDYLADGLYVDAGAEVFTKPGYDRCWEYIHEFQLTPIRLSRHEGVNRRINTKWHTEEMLRDRSVLRKLGFKPAEISYLVRSSRWDIRRFYLEPYLDSFEDEYKPFEAGLTHLDQITVADLLRKDGASAAALQFAGESSKSALCAAWHEATWNLQGASEREVYRLKGGNQLLTDALTSRLEDRIWRGCPVTGMEQGETGITAYYKEFGRKEGKMDADYLVSCVSLPMLSQVQVSPNWSEAKHYAIHHVPYYSHTRVIFQSRTRFWKEDGLTPNFVFGDPHLSTVWEMAVGTSRGLLVGTAAGAGSAEAALKAFRRHYPGKVENIEQARVVAWPLNRWAAFCERVLMDPGEMAKIWPVLIEPHGRIFFAGAYAYTGRGRGMDAATRSAHRVAEAIDQA